jgi:catechol 2,3-dioxygenase-like lactoylglutathione lyase family enzyme
MKRMHVHVAVADLQQSIGFYSALFAAQPSVVKTDYAKWMLDDPRVNFAISTRGGQPGLDHLGIQVEDRDELTDVYARLHTAGADIIEQGQTNCCYASSEKSWIEDPAGIAWEPSSPRAKAPTTVTEPARTLLASPTQRHAASRKLCRLIPLRRAAPREGSP